MGINRITWAVLIVISILLAILFKGNDKGVPHALGMAMGIFLWSFVIVSIVRFFYFLLKRETPVTVKRNTFILTWAIFSLAIFTSEGRKKHVNKDQWVSSCMKAAKDSAKYDIEEKVDLKKYCECAMTKILNKPNPYDTTMSEQLLDQNSVLFNEVIMTCLQEAAKEYKAGSVFGINAVDTVSVINAYHGAKVKVRIGGEWYYFTIDSGASDIMISTSLEKDLKEQNLLSDSSYLTDQSYELADGSVIECKRAVINDVQIGEFLVDSVTVAIYDKEIGFLLGKSFLENFSSWSLIDKNTKLILKK